MRRAHAQAPAHGETTSGGGGAEEGKPMSNRDFDVLVIGGGSGGLSAASRSAGRGLRTALVEREELGGECLWTGCIPAKALLYSAEVRHTMSRADDYGLKPCKQEIDWPSIVRAKDEVVARIARQNTPETLQQAGITFFRGEARFRSPNEVVIGDDLVTTRYVVIATGSRQAEPRFIPGLSECGYITHVEAVHLKELPQSIAIIGAGPVGVEFAQLFARVGVQVTLLERSDTILAREDEDAALYIQELLREEGITILTNASAKGAEMRGRKKVLTIEQEDARSEVIVDEVLLATGRTPNIDRLGLREVGVETTPTGVIVDAQMRTTVPHIFACGDVTGRYLFNHVAEYQGAVASYNIACPSQPRAADYRVVPWATFTDPEVAHVGMTELEARAAGYDVEIERFSLSRADRAITIRKTAGLVKVIADARSGQILGAHIVGASAGNMIHEYALAMKARVPITEIAETIHIYPTLSEALRWAAAQYRHPDSE